jgi:hypothetical protein
MEKSVAPSFPPYETSNRISMPNTSATNRDSQPQPLYGISMNSYPGHIPPPPSLLGRLAPRHGRTVRAFTRTVRPLHGPTSFTCRIVHGHTRTTTWHPNSSEHNRIVRIYHRIKWIHIRRTYCCTLCTKLLHTTTTIHSTPYIFKPQHTIWSQVDQRY